MNGFVIHLVTRDGAHRGWWSRKFPHVVAVCEADVFATAHEGLTMIPTPPPTHALVGEVWSLALALEQGVSEPAFVPRGMRL